MGIICHDDLLHRALQLQTGAHISCGRVRKLVGVRGTRIPERLVHVYSGPDAARTRILQLRRGQSLRQLSRGRQVQLLFVQPAAAAHVR